MTSSTAPASPIDEAAVDWFVLLRDESASEAQFIAFRDWLEASDDHRQAYGRVEALWAALDDGAMQATLQPFQARRRLAAGRRTPRGALWGGAGLAVAAGVAALFVLPQMTAPHVDTYRTAKGQRQEVTLADGSKVTLNSESEVRVQFSRKSRQATLVSGEALFDVVHDPARPFQTLVGDEQIRDIGTAFNVRQINSEVVVTVLHGLVEVRPQTGDIARLGQGDQLRRQVGATQSSRSRVDPQETVSWRSGRLIYRDQPLSEVAADLSRYLPTPVSVDAKAATLRFSGVLQLDQEDLMISRLQQLAAVRATRTASGVQLSGRN